MGDLKNIKLGERLLSEGLISNEQLIEVLQIQKEDGRKFGEIVVERGLISDGQLAQILAESHLLPFVSISDMEIEDRFFSVINTEILHKYKVFPVGLDEQCLTIATNDPLDVSALQEIQYLSGLQVKPVVAGLLDINSALERFTETMHAVQFNQKTTAKDDFDAAPVIKLVENIIGKAIKERASDIHLEPMIDSMRVRFRIDGALYNETPISKQFERRVVSRIKILGGMDVADSRRPQDGRMSIVQKEMEYDIRISTLPDVLGESVVLRILNKSFTNFSFDSLGMTNQEEEKIQKLINRPHGILLVTGPTGAGKSTTLYAVLNTLNVISKNIITVEDPVEYQLSGISQTAINELAGYTFPRAIRQLLRHDPDIIMVGEIRDQETAEIAIRAALTGHLVLSTLHTNSAAGAIMRLIDMGIEPFLIRSSLFGVVAQRLVRRLCPHCKKEIDCPADMYEKIKSMVDVTPQTKFAQAVGCSKCYDLGYSGRVAIYEILTIDDDIRQKILQEPSEIAITEMAVAKGMHLLRAAGVKKAIEQVTSLEEVLSITFAEEE